MMIYYCFETMNTLTLKHREKLELLMFSLQGHLSPSVQQPHCRANLGWGELGLMDTSLVVSPHL